MLSDVEFWKALPGLIWPILAIVIVWKLWPVLRSIFETRKFTIKLGGFELSAQEASEQMQKALADLQTRLAEVETNLAGAAETMPRTGEVQAGDGAPRTETMRTVPAPPAQAQPEPFRILWVDDRPQNNAGEAQTLREIGCTITDARSTDEAMRFLEHQAFDLIISDVGRPEARDAGVAMFEALARRGNNTPLALYSTRASLARHADRIANVGPAAATESFVELLKTVKQLKEKRNR